MSGDRIPTVDRLGPERIASQLARAPLAYLPLGSLEFHGPHLPIGLDALTAQGVCLAAAHRTGGIVLPVVHTAVGGEHTRYPWTLMASSSAPIETLMSETLRRLDELGVRRFVLLSGHFAGEQEQMVTRIADAWNSSRPTSRAIGRTLGQAPAPPVAPDHAGRFETLLLHALHPELVALDRLPDPDDHPAPAEEDPFTADRHRPDHPLHGVFGPDPRRIDLTDASALLDHLVDWVAGLGIDPTAEPESSSTARKDR